MCMEAQNHCTCTGGMCCWAAKGRLGPAGALRHGACWEVWSSERAANEQQGGRENMQVMPVKADRAHLGDHPGPAMRRTQCSWGK